MDSAEHFEAAEACARLADQMLKDGDLAEASVVTSIGGLHAQLAHGRAASAMAGLAVTYEQALRMELDAHATREAAQTETAP